MNQRFDFEDGRGLVPYKLHPNGGGKVADSASVDLSVHLGAGCMVYGYAKVRGSVVITGRVRISGEKYPNDVSTLIEDAVRIAGSVVISGNALIRDHADIRDDVCIEGCVQVMHHARLAGRARLVGWVRAMDSCYIAGDAKLVGNVEALDVRGEAYLCEGSFSRGAQLAVALRRDQARQEGVAKRKVAKEC